MKTFDSKCQSNVMAGSQTMNVYHRFKTTFGLVFLCKEITISFEWKKINKINRILGLSLQSFRLSKTNF